MPTVFSIITISSAFLLIVSVLLQERGTTLGGAFGGEGNVYRGRRGIEKVLYVVTIVLGIIFVGSAIANLFM